MKNYYVLNINDYFCHQIFNIVPFLITLKYAQYECSVSGLFGN